MAVVPQVTASCPTPYRRRRPERTLLYRTVQTHFATWLALRRDRFDDVDPVPGYVEREFRRYLTCGILAHGFDQRRTVGLATGSVTTRAGLTGILQTTIFAPSPMRH